MNLAEFRKDIDSIDDAIFELLEKRMEVVKKIGRLKSQNNEAIYNPKREKEIIERLNSKKKYISLSGIEEIYNAIFNVSKSLEKGP